MYQWEPPGGSVSGARSGEAGEAPLGVEQVEQREQVVLVGAPPVQQHQRAGRLAGGWADAVGEGVERGDAAAL